MVAKVISGKSIRGVLNYNETKVKKGQATCILENKFGVDPEDLSFGDKFRRFEHLHGQNKKAKTNTIHISLNFDPSEELNQDKMGLIATDYMTQIGFGDQPYLVYQHYDTPHPHIHIVTTNIKTGGKRIGIHNLGKTKSEEARKNIERIYRLVRAESKSQKQSQLIRPIEPEHVKYGKTQTKRAITNVVTAVTKSYNYTSLAELNAVLQHYGVTADRGKEGTQRYNQGGLVYSVIDKQGKKAAVAIKASAIYGKPTLANLESKFAKNKELRKCYRPGLKKAVDKVLESKSTLTRASFIKLLRKQNIEELFRENKQGLTYGITFIDHKKKVVFNGSAIGRAYSANALMKHFSPSPAKEPSKSRLLKKRPINSKPLHTERKSKDSSDEPTEDRLTHQAKDTIGGDTESYQDEDHAPWQLKKTRKKKKRRKKNL